MPTIKATLTVLGVIFGTVSLVSFAQHMFNVGLVPVLEEFITFYRGMVAYVLWPLTTLIGFMPPQSIIDFWMLSFLGASAYFWTPHIEQCRALRGWNLNPRALWWRVGLLLIFGFSGAGLGFVYSAVYPLTYMDSLHEEPQDLMKGAAMKVLLICAGAILFFVLNAYMPGG